jgi:hypothetical protein
LIDATAGKALASLWWVICYRVQWGAMRTLDRDVCRQVREVFEEAVADFPDRKFLDQKIVLATTLLRYAASGDIDREHLRSIAASTVQRLQMAS